MTKFPVGVVDSYAELFFLPLVAQLVNDDSAVNRQMIATLIKVTVY